MIKPFINNNRIKQPAKCCIYCGKSYVKKTSLEKHSVICELLQHSKKSSTRKEECDEDEELTIPSPKKMFQMLLELGQKYNRLEEKMEEMNKWVVKKKKKINVLEWLNTNIKPTIYFDNIIDTIIITDEDIKFLLDSSFNDVLNEIFERTIYNQEHSENYPIFAFVQKTNVFYIYDSDNVWIELQRERLIKFLNKVHMKLFKEFYEWKQRNKNEIKSNEILSTKCDKGIIKIADIDFKQETLLSKIKSLMFSKMKTDLKALVEYEFEF